MTFDSYLGFVGSEWSITVKNFEEKVPAHVGCVGRLTWADGRTDGQTHRQTDRRTDCRTYLYQYRFT